MPRPVSKLSKAWSQGYEANSLMARMSPEERKRVKKLMAKNAQDQHAYEFRARQAGWSVSTSKTNSMAEV